MALKMVRAAALALLVLFLGACDVLQFMFGSIFPSTVTLAKAQADLSGKITPADGDSYNLRVVESGGYGYVVLVGSPGGSNASTAYIYDLSLNPKLTIAAQGNGVMVDGFTNEIVVGNKALMPADLSLAATQPTASAIIYNNGHGGIDGFYNSTGLVGVANISVTGTTATLNFSNYTSSWAVITYPTPPSNLSITTGGYVLDSVLDDGNPVGNVILVLSNGTTSSFVSIPKAGFNTAAPAGTGLLDTAPHRDGLATNSSGFAEGSLFAWDEAAQSFVRLDPATMSTTASFYAPADPKSMEHIRFAYRLSGGSFYEYDPKTRVITEYASWW